MRPRLPHRTATAWRRWENGQPSDQGEHDHDDGTGTDAGKRPAQLPAAEHSGLCGQARLGESLPKRLSPAEHALEPTLQPAPRRSGARRQRARNGENAPREVLIRNHIANVRPDAHGQ